MKNVLKTSILMAIAFFLLTSCFGGGANSTKGNKNEPLTLETLKKAAEKAGFATDDVSSYSLSINDEKISIEHIAGFSIASEGIGKAIDIYINEFASAEMAHEYAEFLKRHFKIAHAYKEFCVEFFDKATEDAVLKVFANSGWGK